MTIRIEIAAEHEGDLSQALEAIARTFARFSSTTAAAEPAEEAPAAEEPKRRGRPRKTDTIIEHDPNEGKKDDVRSDSVDAEQSGAAPTGGDAGSADNGGDAEGDDGAATEDDVQAEVDDVAEKVTLDDIRKLTISEYLNAATTDREEQKALLRDLLDKFDVKPDEKGIRSLARLDPENFVAFAAEVRKRIGALKK